MRKKLRDYFIGRYLNDPDVFEQARATMLYQFGVFFFFIFLLPITTDLILGLHKAAVKHLVDVILLFFFPLFIRKLKKLDNAINIFFLIIFLSSLLATMMLNPMRLDPIAIAWMMFFVSFSALIQRGIARKLFCLFFGWVPTLYTLINIKLNGAITWHWIVQSGTEDPPVFLIFIPIILCIYTLWSHTQTIEKARNTIVRQKQIIEEKNIAITDSITYSKRIQQAKLPKVEDIYATLPKSFVLFNPKDIVSGDFYFFHKKNNLVFIAAADCTGHGVPGALMSMVGSEKLEEAVSLYSDPADILMQLNKGIKTSLRQSDSKDSTRDGMDIALGVIDLENSLINFSGANRPLWIVRSGKKTVEEIKSTKKAIGGLTPEGQEFTSHKITLEKGDTFYLFTDGYADQFGGQQGKKLMTKNLKDILVSIQDMPMDKQKSHLETFIEKWRSGIEQVDDILVIGVRI